MKNKKMYERFSRKLKILMNHKEVGMNQLARDTGINVSSIWHYCHGISIPTSDKIPILAKYFRVKKDYFFN